MDLIIVNAYINLMAAIILQAYEDIERFNVEQNWRNETGREYRSNGCYVSPSEFESASEFVKSDDCRMMTNEVIEWKYLYDQAKKELE